MNMNQVLLTAEGFKEGILASNAKSDVIQTEAEILAKSPLVLSLIYNATLTPGELVEIIVAALLVAYRAGVHTGAKLQEVESLEKLYKQEA